MKSLLSTVRGSSPIKGWRLHTCREKAAYQPPDRHGMILLIQLDEGSLTRCLRIFIISIRFRCGSRLESISWTCQVKAVSGQIYQLSSRILALLWHCKSGNSLLTARESSGISLLLGYQLATFEVDQSKVQIATIRTIYFLQLGSSALAVGLSVNPLTFQACLCQLVTSYWIKLGYCNL